MNDELTRFDPAVPVERASTPPASWYTDPAFFAAETQAVFRPSWQAVARTDQLQHPGDYASGVFAGDPYVVLRDQDGELRAFFNVCRHHATCLVEGEGNVPQLICPYHGWTYDLEGRLRKAPRLGGVEGFDREAHGLLPLPVAVWEPLVFISLDAPAQSLEELMRPVMAQIDVSTLEWVERRNYTIDCNWKVFVDNYLDGGYHVAYLHRGLADQLNLDSYETLILDRVSLQVCKAKPGSEDVPDGDAQNPSAVEAQTQDFSERLGDGAVYAYIYPNLMINRYGPIMDVNWVVPLGPDKTLTVFDYYYERGHARRSPDFLQRSLSASDRVQQEDIAVCESVQRGLRSSAFDRGRYAPQVEQAAHQFHRLLAHDLAGP